MAQNESIYTTKIDRDGKITLPDKILTKLGWHVGTQLIIRINEKHEIVITKANLYDTDFGDYDFQKELHNNSDLCELKGVGKEKTFDNIDNLTKQRYE